MMKFKSTEINYIINVLQSPNYKFKENKSPRYNSLRHSPNKYKQSPVNIHSKISQNKRKSNKITRLARDAST